MPVFTRKDTVGSKLIHKGGIINLRVDRVCQNGKEVVREVVEHNGGVVIICQPAIDQIVLVKQYRYSIDQNLVELPAGRLESGEDPLAAAKRELVEETGYCASNWTEVTRFFTAPGFCNEILYLYRATEVQLTQKCTDEDEETEVLIMTLNEAWQMAKSGRIQDAKTVAGIALAHAAESQ